MAYSSDDLAQILFTNWSLTGSLSKTGTATMAEPVLFWGHANVSRLDPTKYIYITKVNPAGQENITQHPEWASTSDIYTITAKYRVSDSSDAGLDASESDIQSMCLEIVRILKTQFDPTLTVGVFMETDYKWLSRDDLQTSDIPELQRTLQFTLTRVVSRDTTVFKGYGGVLVFDHTNSQGVNLPVTNYQYTEAYDVQMDHGFMQTEEMVANNPNGAGIPVFFRGKFNGFFTAKIRIKKADIGINNTNALNLIFQPLSATNETAKVFLIWTETDTEGTPKTYQISTPMYVRSLREAHTTETLSEFTLQARIYKPSTWTIV